MNDRLLYPKTRAVNSRGAVAAGHPVTVEAAAQILRAGGNAFDAAIAAAFAACVAEPVLTSLGGGGFLQACTAQGEQQLFDFFAQTPRRPCEEPDFRPIVADFGADRQEFHIGAGSVATPGMVRGLFAVHAALGSLPMRELVAPAVAAARDGVVVSAFQAYLFSIVQPIYQATEGARALYSDASTPGELPQAGQCLRNPELAEVFELLSREGSRFFYEGDLARCMWDQCRDGGHLDAGDLAAYEVELREPLRLSFDGWRIGLNPAPAAGGLLIAFGLRQIEALGDQWAQGDAAHRASLLVEVMGATQAARVAARAGGAAESAVLAPELLALYRDRILGRARAFRGTTHISVVDGMGNAVAVTGSNGEGCGSVVPGAGFMLNNMLGEEDLNPGGFHRWVPDTRLSSMMCPSILLAPDGRRIALGSGGSNRIRTALLQVMLRLIREGAGLLGAVEAPRLHFENEFLSLEGGQDPAVLETLVRRYPEHRNWGERNLFFGGVHAVATKAGRCSAASDPRRDGAVCVL